MNAGKRRPHTHNCPFPPFPHRGTHAALELLQRRSFPTADEVRDGTLGGVERVQVSLERSRQRVSLGFSGDGALFLCGSFSREPVALRLGIVTCIVVRKL